MCKAAIREYWMGQRFVLQFQWSLVSSTEAKSFEWTEARELQNWMGVLRPQNVCPNVGTPRGQLETQCGLLGAMYVPRGDAHHSLISALPS